MTTGAVAKAAILAFAFLAGSAKAEEAQVPPAVSALKGCWVGHGDVMGKAVTINLRAYPILQSAMFALDTKSVAAVDAKDRYSAHLLIGGTGKERSQAEAAADRLAGFWSDSFGAAYTAPGQGQIRPGGFDMVYRYPDNAFVNEWRLASDVLTWRIVMRNDEGTQKPFASYTLTRTTCMPD